MRLTANPCALAHQTLDKWLQERDDIQAKIVFTGSDNDLKKKLPGT